MVDIINSLMVNVTIVVEVYRREVFQKQFLYMTENILTLLQYYRHDTTIYHYLLFSYQTFGF